MDANQLIARIDALQQAVEQSAANHNGLVGRLLEAKELLQQMAQPVQEVVEACEEVVAAVAE